MNNLLLRRRALMGTIEEYYADPHPDKIWTIYKGNGTEATKLTNYNSGQYYNAIIDDKVELSRPYVGVLDYIFNDTLYHDVWFARKNNEASIAAFTWRGVSNVLYIDIPADFTNLERQLFVDLTCIVVIRATDVITLNNSFNNSFLAFKGTVYCTAENYDTVKAAYANTLHLEGSPFEYRRKLEDIIELLN